MSHLVKPDRATRETVAFHRYSVKLLIFDQDPPYCEVRCNIRFPRNANSAFFFFFVMTSPVFKFVSSLILFTKKIEARFVYE